MITAQAIRFTDNVPAMRALCECLGLVAVVTKDDRWAVMRSASGDVLLHAAKDANNPVRSGQTELTFETDELRSLAERFGVNTLDETFGRSLDVTDPLDATVIINETQTDFYGYETHDGVPDASMSVCVVRFADPLGPYGPFLERIGLRRKGADDPDFVTYDADAGSVGLHTPRTQDVENYATGADGSTGALAHLTFVSIGNPDELTARLREAGYEVRVDTSFGTMLEITDPDGQHPQVHFTH